MKAFEDKKADVTHSEGCRKRGKTRTSWVPTFPPFPTMFSKSMFIKVMEMCDCLVNPLPHNLDLPLEIENIVGKGENAGNQYFLLFPQCFLLFPTQISSFESL